MYGIIYEAVNKTNNKKYIGQTISSLPVRRSSHFAKSKIEENIAFYKAIRKYGKESFEWFIIDSADSPEELDYKETYWIKFFNTYGRDGYNMTFGGQYDKKISLDDYNVSDIDNLNLNEKFKRRILIYDSNGNYVKTTINENNIAKELGLSVSLVNNVLKNRKVSVGGYFLFFEDEFTEEKLQDKLNKKRWNRSFVLFNAKTKECIGIWNNILQCEKEQTIASRRGIQLQLNTIQKQHPRKFICKYIDDLDEELQKSLNTYLEMVS